MVQDLLPLIAAESISERSPSGVSLHAYTLAQGARRSGLIPTEQEQGNLSPSEVQHVLKEWIAGVREHADAERELAIKEFSARGWPFRWLMDNQDLKQFSALNEAVEVVDHYFPAILARGLDHSEDMGLLQSKGFGGSEGIQAKRDPYGTKIIISVYCTTGGVNLEATTQEVEFEPGAKSHVFHLVYQSLPTLEQLAGDVAAHPVITAPGNRMVARQTVWMGEGWKTPNHTRPHLHQSWNTMKACPVTSPVSK